MPAKNKISRNVTKIYRVDIIFAVVKSYPYPVKCIMIKHENPAHRAVILAQALYKLLPKLNFI